MKTHIGLPNRDPGNRERLLVRRVHPTFQTKTSRGVFRDDQPTNMMLEDVAQRGENLWKI